MINEAKITVFVGLRERYNNEPVTVLTVVKEFNKF